mmetsp:Transcript_36939/g.89730  ORF Transcript_36939/g.89730 Transcript_36939/m.89730 type:complete len:234 (+) Transcript_36939:295-996(+)
MSTPRQEFTTGWMPQFKIHFDWPCQGKSNSSLEFISGPHPLGWGLFRELCVDGNLHESSARSASSRCLLDQRYKHGTRSHVDATRRWSLVRQDWPSAHHVGCSTWDDHRGSHSACFYFQRQFLRRLWMPTSLGAPVELFRWTIVSLDGRKLFSRGAIDFSGTWLRSGPFRCGRFFTSDSYSVVRQLRQDMRWIIVYYIRNYLVGGIVSKLLLWKRPRTTVQRITADRFGRGRS